MNIAFAAASDRWQALCVAFALGVIVAIAVCLATGDLVLHDRERDCEAICSARGSACRAVTEWGPLCHDGTLPGRCE